LWQMTTVSSTIFIPNMYCTLQNMDLCNLLMISTPTYHIKIHVVLIFKPCLIHHCGLYILVQMCKDVQLYDEWIRVEENPLVYVMRLMLERGTHWIDVVYAVKRVMDKKSSRFFKNQPCIYKGLNSIAFALRSWKF
jgi:hypothetical protein